MYFSNSGRPRLTTGSRLPPPPITLTNNARCSEFIYRLCRLRNDLIRTRSEQNRSTFSSILLCSSLTLFTHLSVVIRAFKTGRRTLSYIRLLLIHVLTSLI